MSSLPISSEESNKEERLKIIDNWDPQNPSPGIETYYTEGYVGLDCNGKEQWQGGWYPIPKGAKNEERCSILQRKKRTLSESTEPDTELHEQVKKKPETKIIDELKKEVKKLRAENADMMQTINSVTEEDTRLDEWPRGRRNRVLRM